MDGSGGSCSCRGTRWNRTAAIAVPFFASMLPAHAHAAGAPVEVDISKVEPGMMIRSEWRGQPIFVVHRTPEMLEDIKKMDPRVADPGSDGSVQPEYAKNEYRSRKPEYLVLIGICTHLGCSPTAKLKPAWAASDWSGWGVLLSLPWFKVRSGGPRSQRRAGTGQPEGATVQLPQRHAPEDRRRQRSVKHENGSRPF